MEVNIWSDVRCPFCYIGKRKFEKALENFPQKDKVQVNWKSFQLDPNLKTQADVKAADHFADSKGIALEEVALMFDHVTQVAEETGLHFQLDRSVVANSFNAHRLIQFAKKKVLEMKWKNNCSKSTLQKARTLTIRKHY